MKKRVRSSGPLFHELEDERAGKVLEWTVFNLKLPRHARDKNVARTYLVKLGIKMSPGLTS